MRGFKTLMLGAAFVFTLGLTGSAFASHDRPPVGQACQDSAVDQDICVNANVSTQNDAAGLDVTAACKFREYLQTRFPFLNLYPYDSHGECVADRLGAGK